MRTFVWLLLLLTVNRCMAFSESEAKAIVYKFYHNLRIIAEGNYPNEEQTEDFIVARNNILNSCYSNRINLPNEFAQFDFQTNDPFLEASVYVKRLFDFSIQKHPQIKATVISVKPFEEIKSVKSEDSKNFYDVYVKKTITVKGYKPKEYTDVVRLYAENGKITQISNESGGGAGESVITLRGKAAELFANKEYDKAFDMYLKVIQKDPKQGDAYYRLGLMAYHKLGCKTRYVSGKERRRNAYEYMEKASRFSDYKIREYANRVLYYMSNGI